MNETPAEENDAQAGPDGIRADENETPPDPT